MLNAEKSKNKKKSTQRSDLREARPLLQAIFLGIALATALVAAAAMATPEDHEQGGTQRGPAQEQTFSPHGSAQPTQLPY
jgi:Spy/CpxP family protein refolding chaperone